MALKNVWSLQVDEALVANELKERLKSKDIDVFFPFNAQMKDIDLVVMNLKTKKVATIQVKGSRTYPPQRKEIQRYGEGNAGWITITERQIEHPSNKIDFFIFIIHSLTRVGEKIGIQLNYLVLPFDEFQQIVKQNKIVNNKKDYNFFVWINPVKKQAFDFHEKGQKEPGKVIDLTKCLNNWEPLRNCLKVDK